MNAKSFERNPISSDLSLHLSVVGMWLCVSCMGHHVWLVITSKSVFTRVTDGRRLCYYSSYTGAVLVAVAAVAAAVHIFVADGRGVGTSSIGETMRSRN